jgi:beta-xylosidase
VYFKLIGPAGFLIFCCIKSSINYCALIGALASALAANAATELTYTNPVIPGDHPDPSIIRVGKDYWATCTSSAWGPMFPLLHSRDLVNWEQTGAVLPHRPAWATGDFWAPEISEFQGKFFVYFVARQRDGILAVAVATADAPGGPYADHGPMVAQPDGSIDPAPVIDTNGVRYLVWKEDGNSQKQPTPIWLQRLSDDGTKLIEQPHELIRNDPTGWEGSLVEGPFILRRHDWFYLFYSGNGCCGVGCNYALGVARSRSLFGPWEKDPANPILADNATWKCPGHGSIVQDDRGRYFFLYHGYSTTGGIFTGRQALLDEVMFGPDDWPTLNHGNGPSATAPSPFGAAQKSAASNYAADFSGATLDSGWQWPQHREPRYRLTPGKLHLFANDGRTGLLSSVLARSISALDYAVTASINTSLMATNTAGGLCAYGDMDNAVGVLVQNGNVVVWRREHGQIRELSRQPAPAGDKVCLRLESTGGFHFQPAISADGEHWTDCGPAADAKNLPPWDRAVRVALTAGGPAGAEVVCESFSIVPRQKP